LGATAAGADAAPLGTSSQREAAAGASEAAHAAAEGGTTVSAAGASDFATSDTYASLFALGAGTRMPSGALLAAFVAGETDTLARPGSASPHPKKPRAA
jgi:hypothetical protein